MQIIENEMIVPFDCDDTLAMWDNPTVDGPGKVKIEFADGYVYLTPHNYHIQLLKIHKQRGYVVIIWSANGRKHAERVAKALGITEYVDFVMTKFIKHFDDSTGPIIGPRIYIDDLTKPVDSKAVALRVPEYKPVGKTSG